MAVATKTQVLVTGIGGPAGVNITRLLQAREDVHVIGCDIDELAAGRFFVDQFVTCPKVADSANYEAWIKKTVEEKKIELLIPTVDEELLPLSHWAAELTSYTVLSDTETLAIAADKFRSYKFIQEHLPEFCPTFSLLSDWSSTAQTDQEYFIKPRCGRGARGCRRISHTELTALQPVCASPEEVVVMEVLPGTEWTVDAYVAKDGSVTYLVPRERLSLSGGISVKGKTVKESTVIHATKQLFARLSVRGPVCVQWKAHADGSVKFVEINPRLSGGLMISVAAGIDPVTALLTEAAGDIPTVQDWSKKTVVGYFTYQAINEI
jgi:carbamoyl-phosphate synthase large subunit